MTAHAPEANVAEVLLSSKGAAEWKGLPFTVYRSPVSGHSHGPENPAYQFAVIRRGRCQAAVRSGLRTQEFMFSSASFAGYNAGQHWDELKFVGQVESIVFSFEEPGLHEKALLIAEEMPALPNMPFGIDRAAAGLAEAMLAELREGCPAGRLYAESLGIALKARLAAVARHEVGKRTRMAAPSLPPASARVVGDYIAEHLASDLSIPALAALALMSPSTFCACFKGTFGITVHQHVLQQRLARARDLLRTSMPIGQIALECGFASQSRLTERFGRAYGQTPGRFRAWARGC